MDYRAVLTAALHTEVYSDHWGTRCDVFDIPGMDKRAYLRPSSDATLAFLVVPADTLTLARVFFRRTKGVAGVRRLARDPEWRVEHSFHFGFMSTGYAWTTGDIDIDRYLDVWVEAIETAGAVARADWDRYFAWLVEQEVATPKDLTIQSVAARYSGIAGARDRLVAICCVQHMATPRSCGLPASARSRPHACDRRSPPAEPHKDESRSHTLRLSLPCSSPQPGPIVPLLLELERRQ